MFSFGKKKPKVQINTRRRDTALWEAENNPATSKIDLSECGLPSLPLEVTQGILAGRQSLLLQNNVLTSLPRAIGNMRQLRVLDLHDNELKTLPSEIGMLHQLQVLNLEGNKLKSVPDELGQLVSLQTLNLQHNHLTSLTVAVGKLTRLRTLALDHNELHRLPNELAKARALDTLTVEGNPLTFPKPDTSTEVMMREICAAAGIEYVDPSQVMLDALDAPGDGTKLDRLKQQAEEQEREIQLLLSGRQSRQDRLQLTHDQLHHELSIDERRRAAAADEARLAKDALNTHLLREHELSESQLQKMQLEVLRNNEALAALVREENTRDEAKANDLLDALHQARNDPTKLRALLEEQEQLDSQVLHNAVRLQAMRSAAAEYLLHEDHKTESLSRTSLLSREECLAMAHRQFHDYEEAVAQQMRTFVTDLLEQRDERAASMKQQHLQDEHLAAMLSEDKANAQAQQLRDIQRLEEELARLSQLETEMKSSKEAQQMSSYDQERQDMARRMAVVRQELEQKENDYAQALLRAEIQDRANYRAYWEAKLSSAQSHLAAMKEPCDPVVQGLLHDAGLDHLIDTFATHRIDALVFGILTSEDLNSMGVTAVGDQKRVLAAAKALFDQRHAQ